MIAAICTGYNNLFLKSHLLCAYTITKCAFVRCTPVCILSMIYRWFCCMFNLPHGSALNYWSVSRAVMSVWFWIIMSGSSCDSIVTWMAYTSNFSRFLQILKFVFNIFCHALLSGFHREWSCEFITVYSFVLRDYIEKLRGSHPTALWMSSLSNL